MRNLLRLAAPRVTESSEFEATLAFTWIAMFHFRRWSALERMFCSNLLEIVLNKADLKAGSSSKRGTSEVQNNSYCFCL
jgi:hypothetical protein